MLPNLSHLNCCKDYAAFLYNDDKKVYLAEQKKYVSMRLRYLKLADMGVGNF